jgi:hypothetical protein
MNQFIWNKIKCLAKTVAVPIVLKKQQMAGSTPARRLERPAKRIKTLELLSVALDIVDDDDKKDINGSGECFETATQMVNAEVQILKGIGVETNIELWPESAELCKWWAHQTSMPCLMQAALAILANKPSSGGLKCDLGSLLDVLAPKRSSLRAGLVEINMFRRWCVGKEKSSILLGVEWRNPALAQLQTTDSALLAAGLLDVANHQE